MGLWPFLHDVLVLRPPKAMQVGVGFNNPRPVQVNRFMCVIQCTGENTNALDMIKQANMGTNLNPKDHPYVVNWGTLRSDLEYLEKLMTDKNLFHGMVKTWRYQHTKFPTTKILGMSIQDTKLQMDTGYKFSWTSAPRTRSSMRWTGW